MPVTYKLQLLSSLLYLFLIFASVILSVTGSMMIITFLTRRKIDVKEEIVMNRNLGIALVLVSFIWTIGRMCVETIKPVMNIWYSTYDSGFTFGSGLVFLLGVFGSLLIAILVGALVVFMSIKILMIINKDIQEWDEIKQGNVAVAVVIAVTVVVAGMFFEPVVSYIVTNIFSF